MAQQQSEIRPGDLKALAEKVSKGSYGSYLRKVTLKRIRGFTDRAVSFDFPVTALVGPNGGGKTTILGAAAIAYKEIAPRTFFAKSGKYDASMKNWSIEYDLIEKSINPKLNIQRSANYPSRKWNRNAIDRPVLLFGVSRTVPATERRDLLKAIGNSFVAATVTKLDTEVIEHVGRILGKTMIGCNRLAVDKSGRATLFAAETSEGQEYSEFHFGAGEASVIRIVSAIEGASNNTLILIEEIENGLHPVATRRMVDYLIDVAIRKSCQIIFTTHSNEALAPLPTEAIWAAYSGEVLQGKLDIAVLRTISGQVDAHLAIFVEDHFAELMVRTAFRYSKLVEMDAIQIHPMGGAIPAAKVNEQHNIDPSSSFPSAAVLDGDQEDRADPSKHVFTLPGITSPEEHVFSSVIENIDDQAARLTVSLQLPTSEQNRVKEVVRNRGLTNHDRHLIFSQIGEDLDFISEETVMTAFLAIWAQARPNEVDKIVSELGSLLPFKDGARAETLRV